MEMGLRFFRMENLKLEIKNSELKIKIDYLIRFDWLVLIAVIASEPTADTTCLTHPSRQECLIEKQSLVNKWLFEVR